MGFIGCLRSTQYPNLPETLSNFAVKRQHAQLTDLDQHPRYQTACLTDGMTITSTMMHMIPRQCIKKPSYNKCKQEGLEGQELFLFNYINIFLSLK